MVSGTWVIKVEDWNKFEFSEPYWINAVLLQIKQFPQIILSCVLILYLVSLSTEFVLKFL